jgi:hypothetical protein
MTPRRVRRSSRTTFRSPKPAEPMSFEEKATEAYKKAHSELSAVLYEHDPLGAAGGGAAPDDEYNMEATQLMPALKAAETVDDAERELRRMFSLNWAPDPDALFAKFARDVWAVWSRFQDALADAR